MKGKVVEILLVILILGVLGSIVWFGIKDSSEPFQSLPTPCELQQSLIDLGYLEPNSVDCIIGRETLAAWTRYSLDKQAKELYEKQRAEK
jgi:hypothetical protein